MKWLLTITWSKLVALIFQTMAFILDWRYKTNGTVFMFALPFSVFLITGKQWYDNRKDIAEIKNKVNGNSIQN